MPRHSSPAVPPVASGVHPSSLTDPPTTPIAASGGAAAHRRRTSTTLPSGLALAAVVAGAASVGLPAVSAPTPSPGGSVDAVAAAAALAATRATAPPPEPDVATSQILAVPASEPPDSAAGDVRSLRKAEDRRAAQKRGEEQRRADAAAAPADAAAPGAAGFARPVAGRVTSDFGSRSGGQHYGLDVANRIGTPIRAAAPGTVISAGPASGFGLWVRVRHEDGTITVYGHMSRALVEVGQKVEAGELIAEVGNRGQSTGPHLHFEAHSAGGQKLDPGRWLDQRGVGF